MAAVSRTGTSRVGGTDCNSAQSEAAVLPPSGARNVLPTANNRGLKIIQTTTRVIILTRTPIINIDDCNQFHTKT